MPDEIDLLHWSRADTPGPDDAAWNRARTAIAEARAAESGLRDAPRSRRLDRWRTPERRVAISTLAAVVVAAAAALIVGYLQPAPTLNGPLTTAWQPARSLPSDGTRPLSVPAGSWRLMSYLAPSGWQENTTGPEPGSLTCPTATICYVEGNSATSPSGPADMDSFYVSDDGAATWSVLPMPADITFTSALACATETSCAAGGLYAGHQPVYLSTGDGGHSWTVAPLPASLGRIKLLRCFTATQCIGLATTQETPKYPGFSFVVTGARFITTTDGGRHFTAVPFPKNESIQNVSCPTAAHCVAYGLYTDGDARNGPNPNRGVLLTSDDGGRSWRQEAWPAGFGPDVFGNVTCPDATHCTMLGYVMTDKTVTTHFSDGSSVTGPLQYSVIAFSSDGGVTWKSRTFPPSIPEPGLDALACPSIQTCYAAGADAIPQQIGNTFNAGSSVVAVTHDAGRTWQRISFAVPAKVPGGMQGDSFMSIGQIDCPQPDACIAIGTSDQGSTSTPIYTNNGPIYTNNGYPGG